MVFDYQSFGNSVYFGSGKLSLLPQLLAHYQRILIIASARHKTFTDTLVNALNNQEVYLFNSVVQHVPEDLVDRANVVVRTFIPEVIVAFGGGSAIGLAKALVLRNPLPIVAVPTTYSGSEQTNIYGITTDEGKTTGRNDVVLPKVVIYDPELTLQMPLPLAVKSTMNAMAHLVEAIYSPTHNPVTQQLAISGIRQLREALEELNGTNQLNATINTKMLMGAYLGGKSLCEVAMSLHHKMAHVLGGSFQLDHATVHTILLPHVLSYQWKYLSKETRTLFVQVFENDYPPLALKWLAKKTWVETDLQSIGFRETDIERAAGMMISNPYPNPAPITKSGLIALLESAYSGAL